MDESTGKKGYAGWQKAVLIGCALVALLGTLGVIGGLIKVSGTISSYGGTLGAPVFVGFLLMLLSVWLFAAAMYWIPKLNIGLAVIALLVTGFGGFKVYQGNDRAGSWLLIIALVIAVLAIVFSVKWTMRVNQITPALQYLRQMC
jgi:hypothetical protein